MRIGLSGGIASGKTRFEDAFREKGYPVFDTDKVDIALRTGIVNINPDDDVFCYQAVIDLARRLSSGIAGQLGKEFPSLYSTNGNFNRD